MAKNTNISWCDATANFWWGCQKVSDGCKNCYAETMSRRLGKSIWGPALTTSRERKKAIWDDILKWDREAKAEGIRRRVFVQSMSDFLEKHPQISEWRERSKKIIESLEWLDILLLTKRPENARELLPEWMDNWPSHVWFGVTVENQKAADERLPFLEDIPALVKFLSVEPMLEKVNVFEFAFNRQPNKPTWIICGGESGKGCRPFDWDWARDLRDQCIQSGAAFWMKQGGGYPNPRHELHEIPEDLRIRELPNLVK